jgi:hypothetical protein
MSSILDELCKKKCPSLAARVVTMTVPLLMTVPLRLVKAALVSTCDIAPTASAKAPAHRYRFFMSITFFLFAARSGGLFCGGF